jgi:hypothetical protein
MYFYSSQAFFETLGFGFMNDCLIPPPSLTDYEKQKIKLTKEELMMVSFELSE